MSATQGLFEEEIREQYQERAMDYSIMYNDWMREQELDKINQLEAKLDQSIDDIIFDPDKVLTGEAFEKAIKDCQDACLETEKRREITDWDKLNRPMTI